MLPRAEKSWTLFEAAHLLNRAGFGGSPADIQKLHALGRSAAVESLISPSEALDAFPTPTWTHPEAVESLIKQRLKQRLETRKATRDQSPEEAEKARRESQRMEQRESREHALEAQGWWFRRMLETQAPLREKMTLFWHDHFPTSFQKVRQPVLLFRQNELFRRHALGSFKELTHAVHMDPAMMLYLDGQNSQKGMPNENFPREVMELFTLGEGAYTEKDVSEAARAFTGYRIERRDGTVSHNRKLWDASDKTIFGQTGAFTGTDVIEMIFQKKEPARFMAKKLWEYFVYEKPPNTALDALSTVFQNAKLQVAPLLREIFLSKEFYSEKSMRTQIKCPIQFLAASLKQLEIQQAPLGFPITAQAQLGQILFAPPNVAGWDWGQAWINTNTLLTRYNLAGFLTKGSGEGDTSIANERMKVKGMAAAPKKMGRNWTGPNYEKIAARPLRTNPADLVDSLIFRFFQSPIPDKARNSFIDYANAKKGVVFTNKEVAELCHLMLSTPYYQLC
jgi:uncharacterized protein (DUF1800 family)